MRTGFRVAALACAGLLAACAPDAFIPSRPFGEFFGQLAQACHGEAIGTFTVDQLVRRSQSQHGNFFMNQTSRLYHGQINSEDWTTQVTGFLRAQPQDPGIACVIREYNATREWTTPPRENAAPGSY